MPKGCYFVRVEENLDLLKKDEDVNKVICSECGTEMVSSTEQGWGASRIDKCKNCESRNHKEKRNWCS